MGIVDKNLSKTPKNPQQQAAPSPEMNNISDHPYTGAMPDTETGTFEPNSEGLTGLAGFSEFFEDVIPLDIGSAILNGYLERFKEVYEARVKSGGTKARLDFIGLPAETLGLPYSGIAVCYLHVEGITVHTLVLEDDGELPERRKYTYDQGREVVEIPTTVADTFNQYYYETVVGVVQRRHGKQKVFNGGMQVVYRTINMEDLNQVSRVLTSAANAAVGATRLKTYGGDIADARSLAASLKQYGVTLSATVNTNPDPLVSANGLPVRRDICVRAYASEPGAKQNNLRNPRGANRLLAELSAFTTLEYVAPANDQVNPYAPPHMQPFVPPQRYIPRLVMTQITNGGISTLPTVLLGISTATVIQEGLVWTEAFRPMKGVNTQLSRIRDIGALGYEIKELNEGGVRAKIDTKGNNFGNQQFYQLITSTVFPTPVYSIDIEDGGSNSWLTSVFTAAAEDNSMAVRAIIEACDSLTNGMFSQRFKGTKIVSYDDNRVFLGTYRDSDTNELRDIRDLDYLAILNLTGEDPAIIEDFEMTQHRNGGPSPMRLAKLEGILRSIFSTSLNIKGYASRYTFSGEFIAALTMATRDAKVAPMFGNLPQQDQQWARQRVSDFEWAIVQQQQLGSVYQGHHAAQPGMGPQYAPVQPYQQPWGQYQQ